MSRAVICLPGRSAYTRASLGSLVGDDPLVQRAEELRAAYGDLPSLLELDHADRFEPTLHLRPANAAALTFLASLVGVGRVAADHDVVAVIGDSSGWYTALAVAGALAFDDAFRLVQEMALLGEQSPPAGGPGGQVVYPLTDAEWRPDPTLVEAVEVALAAGNGEVHRSVELGAYVVLAGSEVGIGRLVAALPPVRVGERAFPLRLALHGPDHSPLMAHVAAAAGELLADLHWRPPTVTLIDGRGRRFTPWSTDPGQLAAYTLGEQVVAPYSFAAGLRVALREEAPEVLLLPGPGSTLGAICAQLIVAEGYRGIRSRPAFEQAQAGPAPLILLDHR